MKPQQDPYAWAQHLHWMEGAEVQVQDKTVSSTSRVPGVLLTVLLAMLAFYLSGVEAFPFRLADGSKLLDPILLSILLGMLVGNLLPGVWDHALRKGLTFSVKTLLPAGVIFLGARLDFSSVLSLGLYGVLLSVGVVLGCLLMFQFIRRVFALSQKMGTVLAIGTAICGGTAIVALAPLIKAKEEETVMGVVAVTFVGLMMMFLLPWLGGMMGLDPTQYGAWAGLSIHQTPQVIAAGFAHSDQAGEVATVVKLSRVCMLVPVAFLLAWIARGKGQGVKLSKAEIKKMFPLFVLGFLVVALARTLGAFPEITMKWPEMAWLGMPEFEGSSHVLFKHVAGFLLAVSMVGVGMQTKFALLKKVGWRPMAATVVGALLVGAGTLFACKALGNF